MNWPQEYQRQRYEAASTIYGPNTLLAYQQQYTYLMEKMLLVSMTMCANQFFYKTPFRANSFRTYLKQLQIHCFITNGHYLFSS
jgi:hypothetical protein